jgi:REP element-mobilizing transposase RayT
MDRCLDAAHLGPRWLEKPELAKLVVDALHFVAESQKYYELHAYVIMSNHVHMLVNPLAAPSRFLQSLKGFTAREGNRFLRRSGEPFWQGESYDHWVRNDEEFARIRQYIENNPVRAGLVKRAEDFPWSSASCGARF